MQDFPYSKACNFVQPPGTYIPSVAHFFVSSEQNNFLIILSGAARQLGSGWMK